MQSKLETIREFLSLCPYLTDFTDNADIDWCSNKVGNYGIMPTGESIIERSEDICGDVTLVKQYNVALYAMRYTIDDIVRMESAGFLENLTQWVEEQSINGLAPTFGDEPESEIITAQNGMLFQMSENGQSGRYQIQIQINYIKNYKRRDL